MSKASHVRPTPSSERSSLLFLLGRVLYGWHPSCPSMPSCPAQRGGRHHDDFVPNVSSGFLIILEGQRCVTRSILLTT